MTWAIVLVREETDSKISIRNICWWKEEKKKTEKEIEDKRIWKIDLSESERLDWSREGKGKVETVLF